MQHEKLFMYALNHKYLAVLAILMFRIKQFRVECASWEFRKENEKEQKKKQTKKRKEVEGKNGIEQTVVLMRMQSKS